MGMAMVRRRIVGFAKVKRKPQRPPRAPSRSERGDDRMVGESATRSVSMAAPRRPLPKPLWQRALVPAAVSLGLVLVGVGAWALMKNSSRSSSYEYAAESEYSTTSSGMAASPRRGSPSAGYPGNGGPEAVVLSNRATPTDESFRAFGHVHKKAELPAESPPKIALSNASGECIVTGSGSRDVAACLNRQQR